MSLVRGWMAMAVSVSLAAGTAVAGDVPQVKGSLVFAGGELRFDNAPVWNRFVELAGGEKAQVVVVPAAAANPAKSGKAVVENLNRYGARAQMVPIAEMWKDTDYRTAARDCAHVEKLRQAKGIWFVGGDQRRITRVLFDGCEQTPALQAIWEAYRGGAVIGGTSAGTAIMSRWMFADAMNSLDLLKNGITKGQHIDRGIGFIGDDWFVDQHFLAYGRFARALNAMRDCDFRYGIGVDEDTAVVFKDGKFEVIGRSGALVMDISGADSDRTLSAFNMKRARLTYLDAGDSMNVSTRMVTAGCWKSDGKIDPSDKRFNPYYNQPEDLFFPDMLGSKAIYRAMKNALDSKAGAVKGLAFAQPEGGTKNDTGFEFRVYRGCDTIGWYTGSGGYDSYTVLNVYVDIIPVKLANPLYTPLTK